MSQHEDPNLTKISAEKLLTALFDLYADCEQVPELMVKYALCDMRHLCDQQGLAFAQCDRAGHGLYLEELGEAS